MMEISANTETVVHSNENRLASLMYYEGSTNNKLTIRQGNHSFYNSCNNANTFIIDSAGNVTCAGAISCCGDLTVGGR